MPENTTEERSPIVVRNAKDVNRLLGELDKLAMNVADAASVRDESISEANEIYQEATSPWLEEAQAIVAALKGYLKPRRRSWLRTHGRTTKLENGLVKWKIVPAALVTPKDEAPVIAALLSMRGGKKFLRIKWEIERKTFSAAPARVLKRLKPLGVFYTRQETLTIQAGKHKAIELDKQPYPRVTQ